MPLRWPLTQEPLRSKLGPVLAGESATIYTVNASTGALGAPATVYRDITGGTTVAQPLVTNGDGIVSNPATLLPVWLDDGIYAMTSPRLDYVVYFQAIGLSGGGGGGGITQAQLDAVAAQINVLPSISLAAAGFATGYGVSNWPTDLPAGKRIVNNSAADRTVTVPQDSTAGHLTLDQYFVIHRRCGAAGCGEMIVQGEIAGMFETPLSDTPVDAFKISVRNGTATAVKTVTANHFIVDGYVALYP